MVLLLRHTALRISDVCIMRKDAVSCDQDRSMWRIFVCTQKSGKQVLLPIPDGRKVWARSRCHGTLLRTALTFLGTESHRGRQ